MRQQIANRDLPARRDQIDFGRRTAPPAAPARRCRRGLASRASAPRPSSLLNSGMKRDTGSFSRTFPSSIIIITATAVIGFDIEASRKIPSFGIGRLGFDVDQAVCLEVGDPSVSHHHRDRAGDATFASMWRCTAS